MSLIINIAKRYLFGKKSTNVINIITGVSIIGISIGTAALILILSVFNGFETLLSGMFNAFNPDYKIAPIEGKSFQYSDDQIILLQNIKGVEGISKIIEEVALVEYQGSQEFGMIKGVDENFTQVVDVDSFLIKGAFKAFEEIPQGIVGIGMINKLGININDRLNPITVYVPLRQKRIIGAKEYTFYDIYPSGVFSVRSETELDYLICSFDFAKKLLGYKDQLSSIELKVNSDVNEKELKAEIKIILGDKVIIKNRFEQDEAFLKIMNIEKWVSYLIVSFTLLLVAFNLVGCLWMIVLDKRNDISVLKTLGIENQGVMRIFFSVGMMVSLIGLLIGFIIAFILYFLQSRYGLVGVPDSFIISAYPIDLKWIDFIIVSITVCVLGGLASIFPAYKASKIATRFNYD